MFLAFLKHLRRRLKYYEYSNSTPSDFKNSDVYIVEYPKSGITWLSTIMTNLNFKLLGVEKDVTFYNVGQHVADISRTRRVGEQLTKDLGFRLIKSHSNYNPFYNFIIFLVRNPFDVMVSYYKYQEFAGYEKSIHEFIKDEKYGITNWVEHTKSWLNKIPKGEKLHLVKYEELQTEPVETISKLYQNLGFNIPEELIAKAIKESHITNMKESERLYKEHNPKHIRNFVRKGQTNYDLNSNDKQYITQESSEVLEKLYPELLNE